MRRAALGLTQEQLAADFGVRPQTVGNWDKGERPQARFFAGLADFLGLPDARVVRQLANGAADSVPANDLRDEAPAGPLSRMS